MTKFLLKIRYLSMLLYIFEWLIFIGLVGLLYILFGSSFGKEDLCIFTAIWGVVSIYIAIER